MYQQAVNYFKQGRLDETSRILREFLAENPTHHAAHSLLGVCQAELGNLDAARELLRRAVRLDSRNADYRFNLGLAKFNSGDCNGAAATLEKAVKLGCEKTDAFQILANHYNAIGNWQKSAAATERLIDLGGGDAMYCTFLAHAKANLHEYGASAAAARQALSFDPRNIECWNLLVRLQLIFAELNDDAAAAARELMRSNRDNNGDDNRDSAGQYSKLLLAMCHMPEISQKEIFEQTRHWAEPFNKTKQNHLHRLHKNDRIRLGYVSADFRGHVVMRFFSALLMQHNRKRFEVFCYHTHPVVDIQSEEVQNIADHWSHVYSLNDDDLISKLTQDQIDVLIDLSGHTEASRLRLLANRIAPVQISWLGYDNTTGLDNVDYHLSDMVMNPEEKEFVRYYSETIHCLKDGKFCYLPGEVTVPVTPLPAQTNGFITFGSANNIMKLNPQTFDAWIRVLRLIPDSRLKIKSQYFGDECVRNNVMTYFAAPDIVERVELVGRAETLDDHLSFYNDVDIALDSFPYGGATTTMEALCQGVPVVTLAADREVGRYGATILKRLSFDSWVADDVGEYLDNCIALATDINGLARIRQNLRKKVASSSLTDAAEYAKQVEDAYLQMLAKSEWRNYS